MSNEKYRIKRIEYLDGSYNYVPQYKKWLDNHDAELLEFTYKNWQDKTKGEDGSIPKINLTIVVLYRDVNNVHDT
jgi:hypothetical protein